MDASPSRKPKPDERLSASKSPHFYGGMADQKRTGNDFRSISTQLQSGHKRFARRIIRSAGFFIYNCLKRLDFSEDIAFDDNAAFQRLPANALATAAGQTHILLFFYLAGDERQSFSKDCTT